MAIYSRSDWGARSPRQKVQMKRSDGVYVHHSAGPQQQTVKMIQDFHMDIRGWSDIAYNWLVNDRGDIFEGRGWGIVGGATKNENSSSHSICYIGNTQVDVPSQAAKASIKFMIAIHNEKFGTGFIRGHQESSSASTACPGTHLQNWLKAGLPLNTENGDASMFDRTLRQGDSGADVRELQNALNFWGHDAGVADGVYGSKTVSAVKSFQAKNRVEQTGVWGPVTQEAYRKFIISIGGDDPNPPAAPTPKPPSGEKEKARQWVISEGISDGSNGGKAATREQVWVMLYRIHGGG